MSIYEKIQSEIKNAMREHDNVKRDCLRSLVSDIKNQTINAGKEITDDIVLRCIQKSVKQHNDSIESFKAGNRDDLAEKETNELQYLTCYLPKMLSEQETEAELKRIVAANNIVLEKKNMGYIMKLLPNNVDKKIAAKIINGLL